MPFKSKAQMRAAFSGALGEEMKSKAAQWAAETPNPKGLPKKVPKKGRKKVAGLTTRSGEPFRNIEQRMRGE